MATFLGLIFLLGNVLIISGKYHGLLLPPHAKMPKSEPQVCMSDSSVSGGSISSPDKVCMPAWWKDADQAPQDNGYRVEHCPQGWIRYKSEKCLKLFYKTKKTHADATLDCVNQDATLASIGDKGEHQFMTSFVLNSGGKDAGDVWVGGTQKDSRLIWSDNTLFGYTNWASGHPGKTGNKCVYLVTGEEVLSKTSDNDFKMGSQACTESHPYICQKSQADSRRIYFLRSDSVCSGCGDRGGLYKKTTTTTNEESGSETLNPDGSQGSKPVRTDENGKTITTITQTTQTIYKGQKPTDSDTTTTQGNPDFDDGVEKRPSDGGVEKTTTTTNNDTSGPADTGPAGRTMDGFAPGDQNDPGSPTPTNTTETKQSGSETVEPDGTKGDKYKKITTTTTKVTTIVHGEENPKESETTSTTTTQKNTESIDGDKKPSGGGVEGPSDNDGSKSHTMGIPQGRTMDGSVPDDNNDPANSGSETVRPDGTKRDKYGKIVKTTTTQVTTIVHEGQKPTESETTRTTTTKEKSEFIDGDKKPSGAGGGVEETESKTTTHETSDPSGNEGTTPKPGASGIGRSLEGPEGQDGSTTEKTPGSDTLDKSKSTSTTSETSESESDQPIDPKTGKRRTSTTQVITTTVTQTTYEDGSPGESQTSTTRNISRSGSDDESMNGKAPSSQPSKGSNKTTTTTTTTNTEESGSDPANKAGGRTMATPETDDTAGSSQTTTTTTTTTNKTSKSSAPANKSSTTRTEEETESGDSTKPGKHGSVLTRIKDAIGKRKKSGTTTTTTETEETTGYKNHGESMKDKTGKGYDKSKTTMTEGASNTSEHGESMKDGKPSGRTLEAPEPEDGVDGPNGDSKKPGGKSSKTTTTTTKKTSGSESEDADERDKGKHGSGGKHHGIITHLFKGHGGDSKKSETGKTSGTKGGKKTGKKSSTTSTTTTTSESEDGNGSDGFDKSKTTMTEEASKTSEHGESMKDGAPSGRTLEAPEAEGGGDPYNADPAKSGGKSSQTTTTTTKETSGTESEDADESKKGKGKPGSGGKHHGFLTHIIKGHHGPGKSEGFGKHKKSGKTTTTTETEETSGYKDHGESMKDKTGQGYDKSKTTMTEGASQTSEHGESIKDGKPSGRTLEAPVPEGDGDPYNADSTKSGGQSSQTTTTTTKETSGTESDDADGSKKVTENTSSTEGGKGTGKKTSTTSTTTTTSESEDGDGSQGFDKSQTTMTEGASDASEHGESMKKSGADGAKGYKKTTTTTTTTEETSDDSGEYTSTHKKHGGTHKKDKFMKMAKKKWSDGSADGSENFHDKSYKDGDGSQGFDKSQTTMTEGASNAREHGESMKKSGSGGAKESKKTTTTTIEETSDDSGEYTSMHKKHGGTHKNAKFMKMAKKKWSDGSADGSEDFHDKSSKGWSTFGNSNPGKHKGF